MRRPLGLTKAGDNPSCPPRLPGSLPHRLHAASADPPSDPPGLAELWACLHRQTREIAKLSRERDRPADGNQKAIADLLEAADASLAHDATFVRRLARRLWVKAPTELV